MIKLNFDRAKKITFKRSALYDAKKCFDSLWAQDYLNDIFDAGCVDDNFVLLHLGTQNANVSIKTYHGITKRVNIKNIIMQGRVFGSL